jgi:serine/threonine-protein kinase RsbT
MMHPLLLVQVDCTHPVDRCSSAVLARHFARRAGLAEQATAAVAIAVAELISNAVRHAGKGRLELRMLDAAGGRPGGVEVKVHDDGPGIADLEAAARDGYSCGGWLLPDTPRSGLGAGLGSVRRLMDEVRIISVPGVGTTVIARKWRHRR